MTEARKRRKVRLGRVVSDKMDKTVVVAIERRVHHPLYGKSLRRVSKFKAHDEENTYRVGDLVRIMETRPLSRTKHWRVAELVTRVEVAEVAPSEAIEEAVQQVLTLSTEETVVEEAPVAVAEAAPPVEETVVEEAPVAVAEAAPPVEETVVEEAPVAVAEAAPPVEETVVEEAPVAVAEAAPPVEETVVEEAPVAVAETAPPVEETVVEEAPVADEEIPPAADDESKESGEVEKR